MKRFVVLLICVATLLAAGCATTPYRYGQESDFIQVPFPPDGEPQIVQGRPNRVLDASDWIWPGSLLGKLMLWNRKVDSHQISPETIEAVRQYLEDNELHHVKVRFNGYQPINELRRTIQNKSVGAGWRYTFGMLGWLQYAAMPGRFFGGDMYNPYANTINVYSDLIPVGLHEAGHAKDFAQRKWKGTYMFMYSVVPFFNLYPEALASNEALGYLYHNQDTAQLKSGYKLLHPAYGSYVGGNIGQWLDSPWNFVSQISAIVGGHVTGRIKAARVRGFDAAPEDAPEFEDETEIVEARLATDPILW